MKPVFNLFCLGLVTLLCTTAYGQSPDNIILTETTHSNKGRLMDDIVEKKLAFEKRILPYAGLREADILWEKRVWQVLDIREKINLPFAYPERPFFTIIKEAAENGEITVYSPEDDKFSTSLEPLEVKNMMTRVDTIAFLDPYECESFYDTVVYSELNHTNVIRFRLKEIWFFDEESSNMQVRILGIAPLLEEYDEDGNFLFERPLFWVYYPEARRVLAREPVFNMFGNDSSKTTWEDIMEGRAFSSHIYKESNIHDRRLKDFLSGVDLLLEADKIKSTIFDFEHNLWSY